MAKTHRSEWINLRNSYVPNKIRRMMKEEAALQLAFDSAKSPEVKCKVMASLLAVRKQIGAWLGWPTPRSMDAKVRAPVLVAPPLTDAELGRGRRDLNRVDLPPLKRARLAPPPAVPALIDIEPAPPIPDHLPPLPPAPPPIRPPGLLG